MAEITDLKPVTQEQVEKAIAKRQTEQSEKKAETFVAEKITTEEKPVVESPELKKEEKGAETKVDAEGNVIEPEKPKRKSVKELAKPFTPKKAEAPIPADEIPEQYKVKFSDYDKKIASYEAKLKEYEENSSLQILREAEKLGKDAFTLLKEAQGEDYSKLSASEKYEKELVASGVKYAADATDDEPTIEDEMDKFKALPKIARDREIDLINKKYEAANSNKATDFLNKLKTTNEDRDKVTNAQRQQQIEQSQRTIKEWDEYCDSYIGQEHMAVIGTPQMADSLKQVLRKPEGLFLKTDGSLDIDKFFKAAHFLLFGDMTMENLENQIHAESTKKVLDDVNVTGGAKNHSVRAPQTKNPTQREALDTVHNSLRRVN